MSTQARPAELLAAPHEDELQRPESSLADVGLALIVAGFAVAWIWPSFSFCSGEIDEGIILQGAVRILRGEIPYRDFFSFYTPGSYYIYAAVFRVFGTSLLVARSVLLAYAALFSGVTYLLARRVSSRLGSILASLFLSLICLPGRFVVVHNWDSTAFALLALYCAVWFLQTSALPCAFLVGLLTGVTTMIGQDYGAGLVLGLAIAALALYRSERATWGLRHLFATLVGAALPCLAVVSYFAAHHALVPMLEAWAWPLHHYSEANTMPYGFIQWSTLLDAVPSSGWLERLILFLTFSPTFVVCLLPLMILAVSATVTLRSLRSKTEITPPARFVILSGAVLLGLFLANWASGRHDFYRMIYLAPLIFFMLPLLLDARLVALPSLSRLKPLLVLLLLIPFTVFGFVMLPPTKITKKVVTRRGVVQTLSPENVVPYVQSHEAAGDHLLVYPYLPMYAFLTGTLSPTRFDYLQLGMHTPEQFEEARQELERDGTAPVLFDFTFVGIMSHVWPSTPAEALATDPMGDYIMAHYHSCAILLARGRPFAYMVRKDLHCSQ